MDVVCLSCIVIILAISYIFLRKGKGNYALAILPLIFVPLFHLGASLGYGIVSQWFDLSYQIFIFLVDITALVAACLMFGFSSAALETRRAKLVYCIMCGGFTALFTFALIKDAVVWM